MFDIEGDTFEGFGFNCAPLEKLILKEIFQVMQKLVTFNILDDPYNVISKVASTVAGVEKMVIRVGWINKVLEEISLKDYFALL